MLTAMVQELGPAARAMDLRPSPNPSSHRFEGPVGAHLVTATATSIGTEAARHRAVQVLDDAEVDHVVVVGIAGGVDAALSIGDLIAPEVVVDDRTGRELRPSLPPPGTTPRGVLLTSDVLHDTADHLASLRSRGVTAVDMETAAVASVCEDRGVAWTVVRAISDRAGEPLTDAAVLSLTHPDGRARPFLAARYAITRPHRIPHLARLARGSGRAARAAAGAAAQLIESLPAT